MAHEQESSLPRSTAQRVEKNVFIKTITSSLPEERDRDFLELCREMTGEQVLKHCEELEHWRRNDATTLYDKVRASLFLYAAFRFRLQEEEAFPAIGQLPQQAYVDLLDRRFEDAIDHFFAAMKAQGPNALLMSGLAETYHHLAFDILSQQVRKSVRSSSGNAWMFDLYDPADHPHKIRPELLNNESRSYPILREQTSIRLDLTHSGWSDIFFLGMDYPEGARVINISVDLAVYGRDTETSSPISCYFRVIDQPIIRLCSVDLQCIKNITDLDDLFNFGNDYISLLKAAVIVSGAIPPSFEDNGTTLPDILEHLIGPGLGFELVTQVNDIPKGSRLAVSTNLLASIITLLMRATGQTKNLEGCLLEEERRLVASRSILGEWLGGSGGGWQDSGGIWPGIKAIEGVIAKEGHPEFGVSKGTLLPRHRVLTEGEVHEETATKLCQSLVLLHGGMAQNVGPILEMVTEKYLLRSSKEWQARQELNANYDKILDALKSGDIKRLGELTMKNWMGPLKTIIPWVTNKFTDTIIERAQMAFGDDFWGFLMLGGMSGGGMAMFCAPQRKAEFQEKILEIMRQTKKELEVSLPFAIDPQVYEFSINNYGTRSSFLSSALMPSKYYHLMTRNNPTIMDELSAEGKEEFEKGLMKQSCSPKAIHSPATEEKLREDIENDIERIKRENGFDAEEHEILRANLRAGRIGLAKNRLPPDTVIEDVGPEDVVYLSSVPDDVRKRGEAALASGGVAVVSLAAGVGTRWTQGSGVIKGLNPFVYMKGKHRTFLEIQLAKTEALRTSAEGGIKIPHIICTGFLTHDAIGKVYELGGDGAMSDSETYLSRGQSINQRMIPMMADLEFLWNLPQEKLDEQKQKVRMMQRKGLMGWVEQKGQGSDYIDNLPPMCFNPPGHWYEVPNLLKNGVLGRVLREHPNVKTLMVHNIDTLGVTVNPAALGHHLASGNMLTFEVIPRRINDRGGGLAKVNGKVRILEGLAQPRETDELKLSYYNSMTTWVDVDQLLDYFGITRQQLLLEQQQQQQPNNNNSSSSSTSSSSRITAAIRNVAQKLPTYATVKEVKFRWGHGHEDIYPVLQFEKLWSDMTSLPDLKAGFLVVPRSRGQQLKDISERDEWVLDGSKDYVEQLCHFV